MLFNYCMVIRSIELNYVLKTKSFKKPNKLIMLCTFHIKLRLINHLYNLFGNEEKFIRGHKILIIQALNIIFSL